VSSFSIYSCTEQAYKVTINACGITETLGWVKWVAVYFVTRGGHRGSILTNWCPLPAAANFLTLSL
jgi:hypothetical protein